MSDVVLGNQQYQSFSKTNFLLVKQSFWSYFSTTKDHQPLEKPANWLLREYSPDGNGCCVVDTGSHHGREKSSPVLFVLLTTANRLCVSGEHLIVQAALSRRLRPRRRVYTTQPVISEAGKLHLPNNLIPSHASGMRFIISARHSRTG